MRRNFKVAEYRSTKEEKHILNKINRILKEIVKIENLLDC